MKKLLLYFIAFSAITFVILFFFFDSLIGKSDVDYNRDFTSKFINADVTVYRDSYGIPYVSTSEKQDWFFALGFLHAQDRLFQMDMLRRMGEGRLSEIFGNKTLNTDIFYRTIKLNTYSDRQFKNISKEEIKNLRAYSEGVNQFLNSHQDKLPIEFSILNYKPDPWSETNSLLIFNLFDWWLNQNPDEMLEDLNVSDSLKLTFFARQNSFLLDYFRNLSSTSVIVPAKHSITGQPLFYSELKGKQSTPPLFYECFFHENDSSFIGGITLPGSPVILCGITEKIAWSLSTLPSSKKLEIRSEANQFDEKIPEVISVKDEESVNLLVNAVNGKVDVSGLIYPNQKSSYLLNWKPSQTFSDLNFMMNRKTMSEATNIISVDAFGETNQTEFQNTNQSILIIQSGKKLYKPDFRGKADSTDAAWMTYFLSEKQLGISDLKAVSEIPDFNYSMKIKSVLLQNLLSDSSETGMTAKKYLSVWRADFSKQDIGASIFSIWNYFFAAHYFNEIKSCVSSKRYQEITLGLLKYKPDSDSITVLCLKKTILLLTQKFGSNPYNWRWGNINKINFSKFTTDLNSNDLEAGTGSSGYNFITEMNPDSTFSVSQTGSHLILFKDFWNNNFINMAIPGGISEQERSNHFNDQLILLNSHQFLNINISGYKNSNYKLTIRPEK